MKKYWEKKAAGEKNIDDQGGEAGIVDFFIPRAGRDSYRKSARLRRPEQKQIQAMMDKREAEDNSETAGAYEEQNQSEQILSEAERQLRMRKNDHEGISFYPFRTGHQGTKQEQD